MSYRLNIESFLNVITGKTFIKSCVLSEEQKTLFIHFYNSYLEYQFDNPDTKITEDIYLDYFGTFNKIEKWIVLEPARILRDFKESNCIEITLPFEEKVYHATVERNELNKFLGFDITLLDPIDKTWNEKFSDVYGYGLKNAKRTALFNYLTK
ncbi:hypothetical protein [Lysinibacillus sp. K60]|uniref:hypothetical protein n=1 Tax=Lysinibacillus sp. K60 TaxID=2720027 RepID=UPI001C8CDEAD|nr:hypothetical protein [Lysinibacillus sp. K60]MBX8946819.1 hypothetical protein [Lysinibacillus sp. K60]